MWRIELGRINGWAVACGVAMGGAAAAGERMIVKAVEVDAPRAYVWTLWTTSEGVTRFAPQQAEIELALGGKYEWYFMAAAPAGQRGSEGCTVLSYIAPEMLAFSWNAPPSIPEIRNSGQRTQVVVQLSESAAGKTRVTLTQHGFGEGEAWDRYYAYFDRAWESVLNHLKEHCAKAEAERGPTHVGEPPVTERTTWKDGDVTVRATYGKEKRQDFELTIPAPVADVWSAIATGEGFQTYLGVANVVIELTPGGRYSIWPDAPNKVLAFIPRRMLSTSGSAPPQFPSVRKGGTWGAFWLDSIGPRATSLRLSLVGWRDGEKEWDDAFEYFLKNNAAFLNRLSSKLASASEVEPVDAAAGHVLRHEAVIEAPVERVWAAFTTKEGLESWMVALASIDLRVGGKMLTRYQGDGALGDDATIENTILSYEPQRMLSIKATKPPKNFPFQASIENMWSVIYFEPIEGGKTKVTCVGMGYGDDEESRKLRQHFDSGNAWTLRKLQEHFAKLAGAADGRK